MARSGLRGFELGLAFGPECTFDVLQNKCDGDAHYALATKLLTRDEALVEKACRAFSPLHQQC
jgi:hypothetical protein